MTVPKAKETAKAHYRIDDTPGNLVDQQVVDLTDGLIANAVNISTLNILTRY